MPYEVVGIIKDAGIRAEMLAGIGLNYRVARQLGEPVSLGLEIKVAPGAAQQVAKAVPLTWDPTQVDAMSVDAPPDPSWFKRSDRGLTTGCLTNFDRCVCAGGSVVLVECNEWGGA